MKIKRSQAIHGDALEILRSLPNAFFDLCIADPPYNMSQKKGLAWAFSKHVTMQEAWDRFSDDDYFSFCARWITEVRRVVKPNGNLFLFGSYHNIYTLGFILQKMDLKILNSIIWVKPNAQPNITCRMLTESSEQIIWACNNSKDKAKHWVFDYPVAKAINGGKQLRNVWNFPVTSRSERIASHPSQKPVALIERILNIGSKPKGWVLDPFAGVGTTAVACAKTGRNYLTIEKDRTYYNATLKRLKTKPSLTEASLSQ